MPPTKRFVIKESMAQLRRLHGQCRPMMAVRIRLLLLLKQHESKGISKRAAAQEVGVDPNSVQDWRRAYMEGGLKQLLTHKRGGNRPSVIDAEQEVALRKKLHDPANGLQGFMELMHWFEDSFGTPINYKTLNGYVKRKYSAQVKTARKSHIKKDPGAVAAFKKASSNSARNLPGMHRPVAPV